MSASERLRAMSPFELLHLVLGDWEKSRDVFADCIEAAEEISRVEATGTLPDFQPLASALTALREHLEGGDE